MSAELGVEVELCLSQSCLQSAQGLEGGGPGASGKERVLLCVQTGLAWVLDF